jgi:hypothetical protein
MIFDAEILTKEILRMNKSIEPKLITDRDEISNLDRGPFIYAFYQVSVQLAIQFQGRRFLEIDQSETRISKKSSPLKPLCQMNRNLVGSIYGSSSIKNAHFVPIH